MPRPRSGISHEGPAAVLINPKSDDKKRKKPSLPFVLSIQLSLLIKLHHSTTSPPAKLRVGIWDNETGARSGNCGMSPSQASSVGQNYLDCGALSFSLFLFSLDFVRAISFSLMAIM